MKPIFAAAQSTKVERSVATNVPKCSTAHRQKIFHKKKTLITQSLLSGWQDSNLRPPGPKPGAITGLRYIPNNFYSFLFNYNF
jgi:hypothetical protein